MKQVLLAMTVILSALFPCWVSGEEPMEVAIENVRISMEAASERAGILVKQDLTALVFQIASSLLSEQDNYAVLYNTIVTDQNDLYRGLEELNNLDETETSKLRSSIEDYRENYRQFVRDRVRLGFLQNQVQYSILNVIETIEQVATEFKLVCESGRSEYGLHFSTAPIDNLPPHYFKIMVGTDFEGTYSFEWESATNDPNGSAKKWGEAASALGTTASLAYSIGIKAGAAGAAASSSAVSAYAMAAAPYLAVAFAVTAVVADYAAAKEQAKLQNKITKANLYQLLETATDEHVANYYKEICSGYVESLDSVSSAISSLRNREKHAEIFESAEQTSEARETWRKDSADLQILNIKVSLINEYNQKQCISEENNSGEKVSTSCQKTDDEIFHIVDNSIRVKIDEIEQTLTEARSVSEEYEKKYKDKLLEYIRDEIVSHVVPSSRVVYEEIAKVTWQHIDRLEFEALRKSQRMLALFRQNRFENSGFAGLLESEMEAQEKLDRARGSFQDLIEVSIRNVFGRAEAVEVRQAQNEFSTLLHELQDSYPGVDSIEELERLFLDYKNHSRV